MTREDAYKQSVVRAVRLGIKLEMSRCPLWLLMILNRLHRHVPNVVPYDVLAVLGVSWKANVDFSNRHALDVGLLLEKGWSVEQSVLMYRNFRLCHPQLRFDPQMLRTFSRKQLREELGATFGDIVADVCHDPQMQPVFNALLFGTLDTPVPRAFASHTVQILLDEEVAESMGGVWDSAYFLNVDGLTVDRILQESRALATIDAADIYKRVTGVRMAPGDDINPRSFDYDLAAIRAEVRQAGRPVQPDREDP